MSGPNQHYIPRFLQRAFGIRPRRLSIWRFGLGEDPECRRIKRTGASDCFYSAPSPDGRPTLDTAITAVEQQMASTLNGIRSGSPGDPVDAEAAAKVVSHLATRTAHVRSTFGDGVARLLVRAEDLFAEPANVEAMVGLDDDAPNRLVREAIAQELARRPEIGRTGIPENVFERIGFMLLRESWGDVAGQVGEWVADFVEVARSRAGEAIRDGHRKGLAEAARSSGLEATLRTLEWTVESGPSTGAILPDCVVVAFDEEGNAGNHLFVGATRMHAVVMAVSPEKLLFGRRPAFSIPAILDYNEVAARLSHDFFLAPRNDAETERLHGLIGADLGPALDESVEGAFDEFLPKRAETTQTERGADEDAPGWKSTTALGYDVSVTGCGDEGTNRAVEELLRAFVSAMAKVGFQQCYNTQTLVDEAHQIIVATDVEAQASDQGQMLPLLDEVSESFGVESEVVLADAMTVSDDGYTLLLQPLGMAHFGQRDGSALTMEGAAEYFWNLFVDRLR